MKKITFLIAMALVAIAANAAIEAPAGSGIYYDWDSDGVVYVHWTDPAVLAGDVVFPETVEIDGYEYQPQYFGQYATAGTWGNANITSVSINVPGTVPGWMFENCTSMTSLTLGETTTAVGEKAFNGCTSLSNVILGASVEELGEGAFWGDPIGDITIPASMKTIAGYVFGGDTVMTSITFMGVPDSIGPGQFSTDYSKFMVGVSYWNLKPLKALLDVDHEGLQYKVWDAQIDETWNNPIYLATCYTDELVVRRTLKGGTWTPIVLPVWLSASQLEAAFGEGVQVASLTGSTAVSLTFEPVELSEEMGFEANTPYIIKVANDMNEVTIPYVWLSDNYDNLVATAGDATFVGNLNGYEAVVPEGAIYIDSEGNPAVSDGTVALVGLSGYFTAADASSISTIEVRDNVVVGDVDGDGVVTAGDITILYNYLLNNNDSNIVNGDQDGDGAITAGDITLIYNVLLGQ